MQITQDIQNTKQHTVTEFNNKNISPLVFNKLKKYGGTKILSIMMVENCQLLLLSGRDEIQLVHQQSFKTRKRFTSLN